LFVYVLHRTRLRLRLRFTHVTFPFYGYVAAIPVYCGFWLLRLLHVLRYVWLRLRFTFTFTLRTGLRLRLRYTLRCTVGCSPRVTRYVYTAFVGCYVYVWFYVRLRYGYTVVTLFGYRCTVTYVHVCSRLRLFLRTFTVTTFGLRWLRLPRRTRFTVTTHVHGFATFTTHTFGLRLVYRTFTVVGYGYVWLVTRLRLLRLRYVGLHGFVTFTVTFTVTHVWDVFVATFTRLRLVIRLRLRFGYALYAFALPTVTLRTLHVTVAVCVLPFCHGYVHTRLRLHTRLPVYTVVTHTARCYALRLPFVRCGCHVYVYVCVYHTTLVGPLRYTTRTLRLVTHTPHTRLVILVHTLDCHVGLRFDLPRLVTLHTRLRLVATDCTLRLVTHVCVCVYVYVYLRHVYGLHARLRFTFTVWVTHRLRCSVTFTLRLVTFGLPVCVYTIYVALQLVVGFAFTLFTLPLRLHTYVAVAFVTDCRSHTFTHVTYVVPRTAVVTVTLLHGYRYTRYVYRFAVGPFTGLRGYVCVRYVTPFTVYGWLVTLRFTAHTTLPFTLRLLHVYVGLVTGLHVPLRYVYVAGC